MGIRVEPIGSDDCDNEPQGRCMGKNPSTSYDAREEPAGYPKGYDDHFDSDHENESQQNASALSLEQAT